MLVKDRTHRHDAGYTLTEMLIVIVLIALIAAAVTPALVGQLSRARARAARLQVETVATALEAFRADIGRYPSDAEGLAALSAGPADELGWLGPYVRGETTSDPWGRPMEYSLREDGRHFTLATLGADGAPGGGGANQDIEISSGP